MIFDELNTAFVFYDDLDKQNRFRSNCAEVCDYKLICPINTILPFQIKELPDDSTSVVSFQVICAADDTVVFDILLLGLIDVTTIDGIATYLTFNGGAFKDEIPCGTYYIRVLTESDSAENIYYSEIFTAINDLPDPGFSQSIFPVYSAWAWYSDEGKLSENNEPCNVICPYTLLCGNDALLPFQYKIENTGTITSWILVNEECSYDLDVSLLSIQPVGDYYNVIYNGDAIDIPCGTFYSQITIDGITHYSEPILISNLFETVSTNHLLQEDGFKLLLEDGFSLLHS